MKQYRNTWAEINLEAIGYNIQQLKKLLPDKRKIMGVVKANGYGHGSVQVAQTALNVGVDFLMVALLEEAVKLRENGIKAPILVIGRVPPAYAYVAANLGITLSVFQIDWLKNIDNDKFEKTLDLHVEFETGMNRTGVCTMNELEEIVEMVRQLDNVKLTGAYTHFATADEIGSELFEEQCKRYEKMLESLATLHPGSLMTHIGNSAAGIQYPDKMHQYTRFGVAMYGLYPSIPIRGLNSVDLKQAMSLHSELIQVKKIIAGECVSYGATFCAEKDTWIGTVPIGYGDGWRRSLQDFHVLLNGKKMPIVGRICMDVMMIELDQPYEVGQKVTLIGENNGAIIEMDDLANHLDTINYEIPCMLTSRIPRVYV